MSTHIHMTFGLFYLTVIAVAAIASVSTGLIVHLRNRDVRAQYAYIRSWVERPEAERLTSWANTATSAWRRLYIPAARREVDSRPAGDYVWPTPEPWPAQDDSGAYPSLVSAAGTGTVYQGSGSHPVVITKATLDERYRTLAPAVIEANAQQLLDTVAWPDLSEQIAGLDQVRTGRHRADRR